MSLRTVMITVAIVLAASALSPLLERLLVLSAGMRASIDSRIATLRPRSELAMTVKAFDGKALSPRFSPIASAVIGEPPDHLLERLLLDKGAHDGVATGDVVADSSGVYLGRIVSVMDRSSIMAYVSSELDTVTVRIANTDRALGILRGRGAAGARVDYFDKSSDIPAGASVVTSEREEHVPAGLAVATVDHVQSDPTGVFQEATLALPIAFDRIESVVIIRVVP